MASTQVESQSEGSLQSSFIEGHGIDIVTINVGQGLNQHKFSVHKTFICRSSEFFRAAFHSPFREATKSTLDLPEELAEVFAAFYEWLYTGTVKAVPTESKNDSTRAILFSRLFSFAGRLMLVDVRKYAFEEIRRIHNLAVLLPKEFIAEVFKESTVDQVMRRYIARYCAWHIHEKTTTDWVQWADRLLLDIQFMSEVAMQLVKLSSIKYCRKLADPHRFTLAELESGADECKPISFVVKAAHKTPSPTHCITACPTDTVASVKEKIQSIGGYKAVHSLWFASGGCTLEEDSSTLGHYGVMEGIRLYTLVQD